MQILRSSNCRKLGEEIRGLNGWLLPILAQASGANDLLFCFLVQRFYGVTFTTSFARNVVFTLQNFPVIFMQPVWSAYLYILQRCSLYLQFQFGRRSFWQNYFFNKRRLNSRKIFWEFHLPIFFLPQDALCKFPLCESQSSRFNENVIKTLEKQILFLVCPRLCFTFARFPLINKNVGTDFHDTDHYLKSCSFLVGASPIVCKLYLLSSHAHKCMPSETFPDIQANQQALSGV